MRVTERRTELIRESLWNKGVITDFANNYGEPGYQDPIEGILIGHWNDAPKWVVDYLEEAGFTCEWSDEWYVDCDRSKAYRTEPDSYHWQPSIMFTEDGECLTPDDPVEDWIAECEIWGPDRPRKALPEWIGPLQLIELGWQKYNGEFETGWHPGQTDDPGEVAKTLFKEDDVSRVVFRISENSQFYTCWEAWYKGDEE